MAIHPIHSNRRRVLPVLSIGILALTVVLILIQVLAANAENPTLPAGTTWGGVPVDGVSVDEAVSRVREVYSTPLALVYRGQTIQVPPEQLGFSLDPEALKAAAERIGRPGLWDRLWNRGRDGEKIDLDYSVNGEMLRAYLENQIAPRYDQPAESPLPIPGTTNFTAGQGGWQLDIQSSSQKIAAALADPVNRTVTLDILEQSLPRGSMENLQIFLKQTITHARFNGVAEIYLKNPSSEESMHLSVRNGMEIPPDVAYSAASSIKIPIMVSVLRRVSEPVPEDIQNLLERMIVLSENPPADTLMENVIGGPLAPLEVTRDLQDRLGLKNTFLAGYFYFGAPLLNIYQTPANSRTDINLDPDIYNQTTTSDMGTLLTAIYQCSRGETNLLVQTFENEITPSKCSRMLEVLARNEIGVLSEAGVPDGTRVAHKHGWTEEADGFLHTVSDAGVVYSPGSDFVFVIFLYQPDQLLFDPADALIAQLIQVIYNYYNPAAQAVWLGDQVTFPQY